MIDTLSKAIPEIKAAICAINEDVALCEPSNFDSRANAIDFIDFHITDRITSFPANEELAVLQQQADTLKQRFEAIDRTLFTALRKRVVAGDHTGSFYRLAAQYVKMHTKNSDKSAGYDNVDTFVNGLLTSDEMPRPTKELDGEMVYYQKTPARVVFEMAQLARPATDDVFFDIGCGPGQTVLLMHLLTGIKCVGIDMEPAYCLYAANCVAGLNLQGITFINADAREADYSQGSIFFLYTPFTGAILAEVLSALQRIAEQRTIRIYTHGPCSAAVGKQQWLRCVKGDIEDAYVLCGFTSA